MVALVAGTIVVAGPAPQAGACSCASPEPGVDPEVVAADSADVVFVGIATDRRDDPAVGPPSAPVGPSDVTFTFEVERVDKGDLAGRPEVVTSSSSGTCGVTFDLGQRYKIFAVRGDDGALRTGSCSGNRLATAADLTVAPPTVPTTAPGVSLPSPTLAVTGSVWGERSLAVGLAAVALAALAAARSASPVRERSPGLGRAPVRR